MLRILQFGFAAVFAYFIYVVAEITANIHGVADSSSAGLVSAVAAFAIAALLFQKALPSASQPNWRSHVRGLSFVPYGTARARAEAKLSKTDPGVYFGGIHLPSQVSNTHFAVVGATGSGKTLTLRLLMQSVFPNIRSGSNHRALIYDPKKDLLSVLEGMRKHDPDFSAPITILNPFDRRTFAWDMAKDLTAPASAAEVAAILVPRGEQEGSSGDNAFFIESARDVIQNVLLSFIIYAQRNSETWSLRDVMLVLDDQARLREVLGRYSDTEGALTLFGNDKTMANIIATLRTYKSRYQIIAALWDAAAKEGRALCLRDFLRSETILVLGNDEENRTAIDAINQVIFKRLVELMLSDADAEADRQRSGKSKRRTWIFIDEVREAGRLESLGRLMTTGRSKGAAVVLGFQDIEGLRSVYTDKVANEIVGQCSHKGILRLQSPETAQWAANVFGQQEVIENSFTQGETHGTTDSAQGNSTSTSYSTSTSQSIRTVSSILPSEFTELPPTSPETGLHGAFVSPTTGAYKNVEPGDWLAENLAPIDPTTVDFEPWPEATQYLAPWTDKDLKRLGLEKVRVSSRPRDHSKPGQTSSTSWTETKPRTKKRTGILWKDTTRD